MGVIAASGCLAAVFAFAAGFNVARAASSARRPRPVFSEGDEMRTGWLASVLRNGVAATAAPTGVLLGDRRIAGLIREGVLICAGRGYATAPQQLLSAILATMAASAVAAGALTLSPVAALAVPACIAVLLAMAARTSRDSRFEHIQESVPEILRSIDVCLQSGFTLLQTFEQVQKEAKGPLKRAFVQASNLLEAGRPASEALATLRDATSIPELSFVAVALQVQHEAGGSMRQVLEAARDTVESELELRRSLRVHTAQAKLSARIVGVMPIVLVALFSVISEGFLAPFFESPMGIALLTVAVVMQVAGIVVVRRMLSMEISL